MNGTVSTIRAVWARLAAWLGSTRAIPVVIVLITFAVFSPALLNGFVDWDDKMNLLDNPHYRGLGWSQLRWMVTSVLMGHWIPLTWITFGADYLVWGMNPLGYHLTNLLLHAANATVFYLIALHLLRLTMTGLSKSALHLGAAVSSLFFALHPLRAESVAWVTERRDVLSGLFFLLTVFTYLKVSESEGSARRRLLALSVGFFALALASKSIVMTLPFVLILLDFYPLRRLPLSWRGWIAPAGWKVGMEKVPYLLLAVAGGGVALYALTTNSYLTPLDKYPLFPARVAMACYSLWFYVWKTLLPLGLMPLYELPARVDPLELRFVSSAAAVGLITVGLFLMRRRWPAGLAVWVYYAIILVPVSGIFHNGHQLTHDRYSYLSCLGLALLVGAGMCAIVRAAASGALRPSLVRLATGALVVWVLGLAAVTWQQVQVWRDTDTLWRYALEFDPTCAICHGNLGVFLHNEGHGALAVGYLERAIALRPDRVRTHHTLGLTLASLGRLPEAVEHFEQVLEHHPADVNVRNNLAVALIRQGKPEEAMGHLRKALELDSAHVALYTNLGVALTSVGNPTEAIGHFQQAIELDPDSPLPHFGLARAHLALGQIESAQEEQRLLERLDPGLASNLSSLMNDSDGGIRAAPDLSPLREESPALHPL